MDTIYTSCIASTPEVHEDSTGAAKSKLYLFGAYETVGQTDSRSSEAAFALRKQTFPRSMLVSRTSSDWVRLSVRTSGEKFTSASPNLGKQYESAVVFSPSQKSITVCTSPDHSYLSLGMRREMISAQLRERLSRMTDPMELTISHVSPLFRKSLIKRVSTLLEQPIDQDDFNTHVEACFSSTLSEVEATEQSHTSDNRARIITHAIDTIVKGEGKKVSMGDLAEACHCSIRTLEYAFKSRLELRPKEFLTYFRLNCYRHRIVSNPTATLSELAYGLQFKHLGNLAKNYRDLFGILPSASVRG